MTENTKRIILFQFIIIIVLFWLIVFYGKDEYDQLSLAHEDDIETVNRVKLEYGATVVVVSPEAQQQSEIHTDKLSGSEHQQTLNVLGSVLNIDLLIEMRTRYLNAKANANIARAALLNSQQEYRRMQQLNQDNRNVSDQIVLAKEAVYKADQAKLAAAELEAKNLQDNIRQNWGSTLASMATSERGNQIMQSLLSHQTMLVLVVFPLDIKKPANTVNIAPIGAEVPPMKADLLAEAPITDPTMQGVTYYYTAPADHLRADMRVNVQLPEQATNNSASASKGLLVPANAVVWYGGKAWIYKKIKADKFMRFPISTDHPATGGWFIDAENISAEDDIVISGAQLLLSEEFKYQIKNENED